MEITDKRHRQDEAVLTPLDGIIVESLLKDKKVIIPEYGYLEIKELPNGKQTVLFKPVAKGEPILPGDIKSRSFHEVTTYLNEEKNVVLPQLGVFRIVKSDGAPSKILFTPSSSFRNILNSPGEKVETAEKVQEEPREERQRITPQTEVIPVVQPALPVETVAPGVIVQVVKEEIIIQEEEKKEEPEVEKKEEKEEEAIRGIRVLDEEEDVEDRPRVTVENRKRKGFFNRKPKKGLEEKEEDPRDVVAEKSEELAIPKETVVIEKIIAIVEEPEPVVEIIEEPEREIESKYTKPEPVRIEPEKVKEEVVEETVSDEPTQPITPEVYDNGKRWNWGIIIRIAAILVVVLLIAFVFFKRSNDKDSLAGSISPNNNLEAVDLLAVAEKEYGNSIFWVYIYEANRDKLKSPVNIPQGTQLYIPDLTDYNVDITDSLEIKRAILMAESILR